MKKNKNQFIKLYFFTFITLAYLISITKCIVEIPIQSLEFESLSTKSESISFSKNKFLIAKVKIGSNDQEFNLLIDSTSPLSWVTLEGSKDEFIINNYYNPNESTTSKKVDKKFEINYNDLYCKGNYYEDEIKFIDDKKFNFKFGAASETKFISDEMDGIMGLAYDYEEENLSFLNALKKSGITDSLSFSISIDEGYTKGTLYLGKHEDFLKNETISCPLKFDKYKTYWAYNIKSLVLNNTLNEIKSEKTFQVIFDISSNVIVLPEIYFNDIKDKLNTFECKYVTYGDIDSLTYALACTNEEKLPNIKLKLNGQMFILPKKYIFYKQGEIFYSELIFQGDKGIIGVPFFSLFHTLFNKEKKVLRFYPNNFEYIERGEIEEKEGEDEGGDDDGGKEGEDEPEDKGFNMIYLLYIIPSVAAIIIIAIVIIYCLKNKKAKNKDNFELGLAPNDEENILVN